MIRRSLRLNWEKAISVSCILWMLFAAGHFLQDVSAEEENANLVTNPGFENAYEKEGILLPKKWTGLGKLPWFEKPKGSGTSQVSIDEQVAHSGKYSLKISGTNNRGMVWINISKDDVEAAGYKFIGKYKVSGWIKTYNMAVNARLDINYWTRKTEEEKWKYIRADIVGTLQGTTDWIKVSKIITTPSGPDFGQMEISLATSEPNTGIAWFDDISLVKLKEEQIALKEAGNKQVFDNT